MSSLLLIWPLAGIILFHIWTPYWLKKSDPFGFALMHVNASIMGPLAILLFFLSPQDKTDKMLNEEARRRNKRS